MTFKFTSVTLTFPLSSRLQIHFIHTRLQIHFIHISSCCSVIQSCLTFCDPMNCATQASMSFSISQSLLKLVSIESMMSSNHLILCHPLLLLPSIFSSIKVFSYESPLRHQVAKVLELQLQHQSFQWICRVGFLVSWPGYKLLFCVNKNLPL